MTTRATVSETEPELNDRQGRIVALVRQQGFAPVSDLAARFGVTPQTIRRDVNALCDAQILARFHGGVGLPSSTENENYGARRENEADAKRAIGRLVAETVPHRASIFVGIGTTAEETARALQHHEGLRVVTNNLHVVTLLRHSPDGEIALTGGEVRRDDGGLVGESAARFLSDFRPDYAILGTSGIGEDGMLLDFDAREVPVIRAAVGCARRTFVVADHTKFGRAAMLASVPLRDVDTLFTDRPPPREFADVIAAVSVSCLWPAQRP